MKHLKRLMTLSIALLVTFGILVINPSDAHAAARSFRTCVKNFTGLTLTKNKNSQSLSHGIWSGPGQSEQPPSQIPPYQGQDACWQSESQGFATGTEGSVSYASNGTWSFYWDDPYAGSNGFSVGTPNGYGSNHTGISGNNASTTVFLYKS